MKDEVLVDCHVHVTPEGTWFNTDIQASFERLMEELSRSIIKKVVLLPVGKTKEELVKRTNYIAALASRYSEKIMGFAAYFEGLDIQQVKDSGLIGIKIHPRQNHIDILSKKLFSFYEIAEENKLPIIFDSYCTPISDVPLEMIQPSNYAKIAKYFPKLKIILAHSGMPMIWEAYTVIKWYKNVFADLSHILEYFKNTSLLIDLGWIVKKIPHKFIYGSDFPEMKISNYFEEFKNFCEMHALPFEEVVKNFYRIFEE